MINPTSPKDGQWQENERSKPQQHPKATINIFMDKYKEGRARIKERKNRNIRNVKSDSLVSLSQASTSVVGSSSNKQSRTPPR
jgi:hypothetical protein